MSIYNSKLWLEDLDSVLQLLPELEELEGKSVLITGVGGLICSAVADLLLRYNETLGENPIRVLAAGRSDQKIRERFDKYFDHPYFEFVSYDAAAVEVKLPSGIDYIIHGASNASPANIVREPVETMLSNFMGLYTLLSYARVNQTERVLYVSSSEVYGKKSDNAPFKEDEYGFVDLLSPRNSYSVGKRAAETLCASFLDEYGVETVIVRPGHIYGPTASNSDSRVSSAWAYDVARGKDIVMKSDGAQIRSYVYCLDCASAIIKVLLQGEQGRAYNVSNPDSVINIREMAQLLTAAAKVYLRMELPTEEERKGFNPMSNSSLESTNLRRLGWRACFDATTGFEHTVRIIQEARQV